MHLKEIFFIAYEIFPSPDSQFKDPVWRGGGERGVGVHWSVLRALRPNKEIDNRGKGCINLKTGRAKVKGGEEDRVKKWNERKYID